MPLRPEQANRLLDEMRQSIGCPIDLLGDLAIFRAGVQAAFNFMASRVSLDNQAADPIPESVEEEVE
jgi:hypothetical protein